MKTSSREGGKTHIVRCVAESSTLTLNCINFYYHERVLLFKASVSSQGCSVSRSSKDGKKDIDQRLRLESISLNPELRLKHASLKEKKKDESSASPLIFLLFLVMS